MQLLKGYSDRWWKKNGLLSYSNRFDEAFTNASIESVYEDWNSYITRVPNTLSSFMPTNTLQQWRMPCFYFYPYLIWFDLLIVVQVYPSTAEWRRSCVLFDIRLRPTSKRDKIWISRIWRALIVWVPQRVGGKFWTTPCDGRPLRVTCIEAEGNPSCFSLVFVWVRQSI